MSELLQIRIIKNMTLKVVDQLTLMDGNSKMTNSRLEISSRNQKLKSYAERGEGNVISRLNRNKNKKTKKLT